jgi:alpha-L-rhamnosidase
VYALAIVFGLVSGAQKERGGRRLAELATANGYRVATGFAGTPFVLDALTDTGHLDVAYRLLLERECPSWLYPVTMGATTVWERWDSMLPDGSINPGEMTSFNHYALGAVADWMHRAIGGIAPLDPGYAAVLVAPRPGGGLTWARASLQVRRGRIATEWHVEGDELVLTVDVPDETVAVVRLPGAADTQLGAGRHELRGPAAVV